MKKNARKFRVGDQVMFYGNNARKLRESAEEWYPPVGTVGKVIDWLEEDDDILVQWPNGTTASDHKWFCSTADLRLVDDPLRVTVSFGGDIGECEMMFVVPKGENDINEYVEKVLGYVLNEDVRNKCKVEII